MKGRHIVITGAFGALGSSVRAAFEATGAELHMPSLEMLDLSDEAAVVKYYEALPELWASIHLAGGYAGASLVTTTLTDVRRQLDMNFVTAFLCTREAAKRGAKRIVNVASRAALEPGTNNVAYAASKAALVMLTKVAGAELKEQGVLVNAVAPSTMDTPANRKSMPTADFSKWASTNDVAKTILWLASDLNSLTWGTVVPVYGAS